MKTNTSFNPHVNPSIRTNATLFRSGLSTDPFTTLFLSGLSTDPVSKGTVTFEHSFPTPPMIFTQMIASGSDPDNRKIYYINVSGVTNTKFNYVKLFHDSLHQSGGLYYSDGEVQLAIEPFYWVAFYPQAYASDYYLMGVADGMDERVSFPKPFSNYVLLTQPYATSEDTIFSIQILLSDANGFTYSVILSISTYETLFLGRGDIQFYWLAIKPAYELGFLGGTNTQQQSIGTQIVSTIDLKNAIYITQMKATDKDTIYKCNITPNISGNQFSYYKYRMSVERIDTKEFILNPFDTLVVNTASLEPFDWVAFFEPPPLHPSLKQNKWISLASTNILVDPIQYQCFPIGPTPPLELNLSYEFGKNTDHVFRGSVSFTTIFSLPPLVFTQMISNSSSNLYYINVFNVSKVGFSYIKLYHGPIGRDSTGHDIPQPVLSAISEDFYWMAVNPSFTLFQMGTISNPTGTQVSFENPFNCSDAYLLLTQPLSNSEDTIYSIQIQSTDGAGFSYSIQSVTGSGTIQNSVNDYDFCWIAIDYFQMSKLWVRGGINVDNASSGLTNYEYAILITQMKATNKENMYKCNVYNVTSTNFEWNKLYMYNDQITSTGIYPNTEKAISEQYYWLAGPEGPGPAGASGSANQFFNPRINKNRGTRFHSLKQKTSHKINT